jgi:hypothetical protein
LKRTFDTKNFLRKWIERKENKEKEEWLFAIAIVKAGLEREGNFDLAAQEEIASALRRFRIASDEFEEYLEENRYILLRLLESHPQ